MHVNNSNFFLCYLLNVICLNHFNKLQFHDNKQIEACKFNLCPHEINPIISVVFDKPIHKIDLWVKTLPIVYSNLQIMHFNIYGYTRLIMDLSLTIKRT
jgi:hypothetical protein